MSGLNFDDFKKFAKDVEKLTKSFPEFCENFVNLELARLSRDVTKVTPTYEDYPAGSGKVGGTLKSNWNISPAVRSGDVYEGSIFNPIHYGPYVEYGHRTSNHKRWIPGQYFLTRTELKFNKYHQARIDRAFNHYIKQGIGDNE